MSQKENFDDVRPFYDDEVHEALQRMIKDPIFQKLVEHLWPSTTPEEITRKAESVNSSMDFQVKFMHPAIRTIVDRTSTELTCSGLEKLDKNKSYLFVANHRDILLDSAILQMLLVDHGFATSEITIGDNLLQPGFISDFGRINRMFSVQREGTSRELYDMSKRISAYIRHTITEKNVSVWIAQRNGRAKDGLDQTQPGLLKMLNISGTKSLAENFRELRIVPVSISYEYEPCDKLKARELSISENGKYTKAPGEDMNSTIKGILQPKGRIHLAVGTPISDELSALDQFETDNEKIRILAGLIDKQIFDNYRLWPTNYIAADLMAESQENADHYTEEEKKSFISYLESLANSTEQSKESMLTYLLKIYGNPVRNVVLREGVL
jgi:1-acyl-sn-glycerol-3-phosphate acyltransferase